ncbi:unnamed protein product [Schistocephalus solidus]|uniref:Uncharacterized protein n=1 Tax=Schistocephalus solidus TaxID=70667 RepID=A0A183SAI8_SCHSO|nr:unnamed protein product [Schistocephalus solidus]
MAAEKHQFISPYDEDVSGLQLQVLPLSTGNGTTLCDVLAATIDLSVPPSHHHDVFSFRNNLSPPGSRGTDKV